jgi:hypothetical protein
MERSHPSRAALPIAVAAALTLGLGVLLAGPTAAGPSPTGPTPAGPSPTGELLAKSHHDGNGDGDGKGRKSRGKTRQGGCGTVFTSLNDLGRAFEQARRTGKAACIRMNNQKIGGAKGGRRGEA